jgi:pseudaminic acid biosynthesis-associated methylase
MKKPVGKEQIDFWTGSFGSEYTQRNTRSQEDWDQFHLDTWGLTKIEMLNKIIGNLPRDLRILEVGCNTGMQLEGLRRMGFNDTWGIEIQANAVEYAHQHTPHHNIVCSSGFEIPFRDKHFDLVFTSGVLIHINPSNLGKIMQEMVRCSKRFILGFEYFEEQLKEINYRGHSGFLWKANYPEIFKQYFPNLRLVQADLYPYVGKTERDILYLLELPQ